MLVLTLYSYTGGAFWSRRIHNLPMFVLSYQLQTPTSMASSVVEVLHEFAQITISAAVGQSNVSS